MFISEAGIALLDDEGNPIAVEKFEGDALDRYRRVLLSLPVEEFCKVLEKGREKGVDEIVNGWEEAQPLLEEAEVKAVLVPEEREKLESEKLSLMVKTGLVSSEDEAFDLIRSFAIYESERKIREKAAQPDLQVIQAIQALDDLDKTFNLISMRVREWYGLHFPELDQLIDEPIQYVRFVKKVGRRDDVTPDRLKELNIGSKKAEAVLTASERSKGGDIREEDMDALSSLAELGLQLYKAREKLARHIERNMKELAPNVTAIAGPTIGARILAKAGSLEKLARLPASTIQVLGAEKALFRALRRGTKPPKHGILFQHPLVHSAPKWQRGKVARVIAAKLAIAARIDLHKGELDKELIEKLKERIREIKVKYPKPKKAVKKVKKRGRKRRR